MKNKIILILLVLLLFSCGSSKKISLVNMANLYNNRNFTSIEAVAFIRQAGETEVYVAFNLNDLVYEKSGGHSKYTARYTIHYDLFGAFEDKKVQDSATIYFADSMYYGFDKVKVNQFVISHPLDQENVIQITLEDLNGMLLQEYYLQIGSGIGYGKNDFVITERDSTPILTSILDNTAIFRVRINDPDISQLTVRYYQRDFPIAVPPFWNEQPPNYTYQADSFFVVTLDEAWSDELNFPATGIYQFQVDTSLRAGKSVFRFYEGFPQISSPERLLEPLRYISTAEEYDELKVQEDLKVAVDRFWLDNAGNPMRAKNMIKKFYSRVVDANELFSSYLEGWKTDRGLIYIIFGPPNIVYRANFYEEWIYGEAGNSNSIKFQFAQVDNPFTDNDFTLYRMPSYKERWYNVVAGWRR